MDCLAHFLTFLSHLVYGLCSLTNIPPSCAALHPVGACAMACVGSACLECVRSCGMWVVQ